MQHINIFFLLSCSNTSSPLVVVCDRNSSTDEQGQRAGGGDVLEENLRELTGGMVHRPQCFRLPVADHLPRNAEFRTYPFILEMEAILDSDTVFKT